MTMRQIGRHGISVLAGLMMTISAQAVTRTWDGGGDGRNWTEAANWNPDGTTGNADILTVGSSASVTNGQSTFASLEIQTNASVTLAVDLTSGRTLSVAGDAEQGRRHTAAERCHNQPVGPPGVEHHMAGYERRQHHFHQRCRL